MATGTAWVFWLTFPIYLGQLIVMGWSILAGVPAELPPGFIGCIPNPKTGTGIRLSSLYIAALVFDATIFVLTLGRAIYYRFTGSVIPLATLIIRDGTLYFAVIFIVNLTNVFLLSADLSAINAPFATMITAILVARLMLNLRAAADTKVICSSGQSPFPKPSIRTMSNFQAVGQTTTLLGRIGADEFAVPLPDSLFESSCSESEMSFERSDDIIVEEYQIV
ncbi:hypothetical protein C0995_010284 [Termitomyces sp. Mi166|nr:hypothetical protein C0995_010284 [Termitomyces sp. Mi166\